jgi:hypothetical protein
MASRGPRTRDAISSIVKWTPIREASIQQENPWLIARLSRA